MRDKISLSGGEWQPFRQADLVRSKVIMFNNKVERNRDVQKKNGGKGIRSEWRTCNSPTSGRAFLTHCVFLDLGRV